MRIFRQNFFVLYHKRLHEEIDPEVERHCRSFCRDSYREVLRLQIFMAENDIPITYTDTISLSELNYLFEVLNDYLKEKNDSIEKMAKEMNKG